MVPLGYYAFRIEPASLRLTHYDVALDHAPHLKGLKIAVISDLHGGAPFIDAAKVARVVALTNQARPDLILLTGDLNGHVYFRPSRPVAEVIGRLKPLSAPLGVHAVIGNHDRWEGAARVTALLKKAGIPVLENAHAVLRGPSGPFYLVGVGDAEKKADDPELALRRAQRACLRRLKLASHCKSCFIFGVFNSGSVCGSGQTLRGLLEDLSHRGTAVGAPNRP